VITRSSASGYLHQQEKPQVENSGCVVPNYSRLKDKSTLGIESHLQKELEVSRGILLRVREVQGFSIAVFNWGAVAFPPEMEEQLRKLIGRKIAILKLDGRFHVRDLEMEANA
jgi:hypothetical protein